ncbi:IS630 family transposase, partial [Xenorhabdus eapokensis]|uniref:IS630 family transposase n=1 Tax=Xenorhabdus eapokensis TaxID=1873482 RepID=UPI00093B3267
MVILPPIPRNERRLMKKMAQKTNDKKYAIRILSILMIHQGQPVFHVAETLCVAQSSVWRWIKSFRTYRWLGLQNKPSGRHQRWELTGFLPFLFYLLKLSPQQFGYERSRWSLELFMIQLNELTHIKFSISTLYRFLCKNQIVWRRAAPTLHEKDPEYEEKMKQINQALLGASKEHPVFYEDEVDIHFNPKIGSDWYLKGQQKRIITPGKNQKYYFAGCFDSQTHEIFYTGSGRKNSYLFINML